MLACQTAKPTTEEEAPVCYLYMLGTDKEKPRTILLGSVTKSTVWLKYHWDVKFNYFLWIAYADILFHR